MLVENDRNAQISVLLVCLGNICRSSLAEGVFRDEVEKRGLQSRLVIDSAGTGGWHAGEVPDRRTIFVAARYGVDISAQKARKVTSEDFERFDLILGPDRQNVADLKRLAGLRQDKIHLYQAYALGKNQDVPDPYYGDASDFERVYRMVREASQSLVAKLLIDSEPSGQASSTI